PVLETVCVIGSSADKFASSPPLTLVKVCSPLMVILFLSRFRVTLKFLYSTLKDAPAFFHCVPMGADNTITPSRVRLPKHASPLKEMVMVCGLLSRSTATEAS